MVQFVRENEDCFDRNLTIGHITGSAWIVEASGKRVLLTHHRKLNIWVQPGGHSDGDPDVAAVAFREAREETGISGLEFMDRKIFDVDIHAIPARRDEPRHEHFDVRFALRAVGSNEFVVSDESHDLAWVSLDDLEQFTTEPSMLRMRRKWLRQAHA